MGLREPWRPPPVAGAFPPLWDFQGNGVIDFISTTTHIAVHTYTSKGTTPCVQVQNSDGLMAEYEFTIEVKDPISSYPTANITPTGSTTINIGENISFVGEGLTGTATGSIVRYEWDFDGDGSYDLGGPDITSTNYTYLKAGKFPARLKVTESSGLTGEDTITTTVNAQPAPEVQIIQPGRWCWRKDGKRAEVKGQITIWVRSIPRQATHTLDLRYRLVGEELPDKLTLPEDDPPEPSDGAWETAALTESTFVTTDARTIGFITTLDTSTLPGLDNDWYEIIAVANYDTESEAWNAGQTHKRVFIKVKSVNPEVEETSTERRVRLKRDRSRRVSKKDEVTVAIPYEGVTTDTDLTLSIPGLIPPSGGLSFTNNYREISLSGNAILRKPVRVNITYLDVNKDGTVDGTTIPENTLIMYRYDTDDNKWEPLLNQIIEPDNDMASAVSPALGIFGLAGQPIIDSGDGGDTVTGSSGPGGSRQSKDWWRCGAIGLEALVLVFIMSLLFLRLPPLARLAFGGRRKNSSRKICR